MPNTYLNDNLTAPYPFLGETELPFPASCIIGLGLCVRSETSLYPIYATSISIGPTSVYMVLCYTSSGKQTILGTLFADTTKEDKTGILQDINSNIDVSGYMVLGKIPDKAVGQYNGKFILDPSCVSSMNTLMYGTHGTLKLNKEENKIGQILSIDATGLLTIYDGVIKGTEESDSDALYVFSGQHIYEQHVQLLNGIDMLLNGTTRELRLESDNSISFYTAFMPQELRLVGGTIDNYTRSVFDGAGVTVVINGGTAFPSCYTTGDQADTVTPYSG